MKNNLTTAFKFIGKKDSNDIPTWSEQTDDLADALVEYGEIIKLRVKVSFDYDGTFELSRHKKLAKWHIAQGHDVWITTARFSTAGENMENYPAFCVGNQGMNDDIHKCCNELDIPLDKIQYCGTEDKSKFLKGFDIHYDDNHMVVKEIINADVGCVAVWIR